MPAAWRLDRYLDADVEDDEDISMASLRGHRLKYDKSLMRDDMSRNDNVDDLKVRSCCRREPLLSMHIASLCVDSVYGSLFLRYILQMQPITAWSFCLSCSCWDNMAPHRFADGSRACMQADAT